MILPFRGNFRLTQEFGVNKASYEKFGMMGHNGLDYGLPTGTQIIAPHGGKIIEAASDPSGYGLYVKIENEKEGSVLAHLQSIQVKVGDVVSEGQPIGLSDNTGNSTGPHLHWGYYLIPRNRQNGYAGYINQLPLIMVFAPVTPVPLETPNPGYAPTFEGMTVEKDGITYKSYKDTAGKLLWKIESNTDWKKKYEDEVKAHAETASKLERAFQEAAKLQERIIKAKAALG